VPIGGLFVFAAARTRAIGPQKWYEARMRTLIPHPEFASDAEFRIAADVARRQPGLLALTYIVSGDIGALRLPAASAPLRANGLWQTTCFEAFVRGSSEAGYCEFNFAPSTQWSAYAFDGYRSGMRDADLAAAPRIDVRLDTAQFALRVALDLDRLADLPRGAVWRLGLSAVIEETNGRKSYWALAHPQGKPDFHHSDCFALEVPTA
jgi:hypothetical protein